MSALVKQQSYLVYDRQELISHWTQIWYFDNPDHKAHGPTLQDWQMKMIVKNVNQQLYA